MRTRTLAVVALAAGLTLGACGGGGSDSPAVSPPAAPGANVDPNANGVYTGPINRAKNVANQQEQHDQQLENSATQP